MLLSDLQKQQNMPGGTPKTEKPSARLGFRVSYGRKDLGLRSIFGWSFSDGSFSHQLGRLAKPVVFLDFAA
jgi:hypothetical protein